MTERGRIITGLAAEVAFAVFPLLVVLMVTFRMEHPFGLFASPEWSFGAAILIGQTIVKFVSGLMERREPGRGPVALALALLLVFGLAPAVVILVITLQAFEARLDPGLWIKLGQVLIFTGAAIVYLLLGTVGELLRRN